MLNGCKRYCRSLRSLLQICQQSSGGEAVEEVEEEVEDQVEDQQRQQEEEGEEKVTK